MTSILYLAVHGFLCVFLALRIIRLRWKHKVSIGHGEKPELQIATRVFGNHNEYAPLFLLLLYVSEAQGAGAIFVNIFGLLFTFGRILHAIALTKVNGKSFGRQFGMISTFTSIIACAFYLLMHSQWGF